MRLVPIAASALLAVVASHATIFAQSPLERLRAEPDWRARNRIARELVADPGLDVRGLLPALADVGSDFRDSTAGPSGASFGRSSVNRVDLLPPLVGRWYRNAWEGLLGSADELVVHRSADELAIQILALRRAEQIDAVHDAIVEASVESSYEGITELAARRPERAIARLLAHEHFVTAPGRIVRTVANMGPPAEGQILRWLDDPVLASFAVNNLEPRMWDPATAAKLALWIGSSMGSSPWADQQLIRCLGGGLSPDAAVAVESALMDLLEHPAAEYRKAGARALAAIDLPLAVSPATLESLVSMLDAEDDAERAAAADAMSRIGRRTALPSQAVRRLATLAFGGTEPAMTSAKHGSPSPEAAGRALRTVGMSEANREVIATIGTEFVTRIRATNALLPRKRLIEQLGSLGPGCASTESIATLADAAGGSSPSWSMAACAALVQLGPAAATALPALFVAIRKAPHELRRNQLLLAAFAMAPRDAGKELGEAPIDIGELTAALASGSWDARHRREMLGLCGAGRSDLRLAVVGAIRRFGGREDLLLPWLSELAADPDARVRESAIDLALEQAGLGAPVEIIVCAACDRLADPALLDPWRRGHLTLLALLCGVVPRDALGRVLSSIAALPDRGWSGDSGTPYPHDAVDPPAPLGKNAFAIAIRNLPKADSSIAFLDGWMDSGDRLLRRAAAAARIEMERR
ncbi:MAG: hypothetical protein HZB39_15785 [Planctomycetes bacterium]|nr:hypothetical protein [Planctomycetota bacterium]